MNIGNTSSSWQAQWLAQSSPGTKDVLRCVCCRLTFPTLAALSAHMKEAKHGPPVPSLTSPKISPQQHPQSQQLQQQQSPVSNHRGSPPSGLSHHDASLLLKGEFPFSSCTYDEPFCLVENSFEASMIFLLKSAENLVKVESFLRLLFCPVWRFFRFFQTFVNSLNFKEYYTIYVEE